ncbi:efflux RND transporter permease subunit [Sporosarcina aquimarina]|uniref:Efflux RND transporter permease subunit n=1 Tax=Sporosarcina aquimarina TaxID=114975 RepID=A0ABU4FYS8_9BACL|nr:efflux RND transporter permease subunit [Sporosarcina aquimarina]MDW0109884.1 efflux RND transporter permease subunit [Sporosarcina aquimarina]
MAFLLKRSKLFIFLIFILMLVGVYTFLTLPKREIPETPVDLVMVSSILPGAEPEEVERTVTNPLERAVKKVDGIDTMKSVSANSASIITLSLKDGIDSEQTINKLQQEVQRSASELPENAQTPEVKKLDLAFPLVSYMFTGDETALADLETSFATLSDDLQSIEGVAGTTVKGFAEKEVMITLDPDKLAENRLQPFDVLNVLQQANQPLSLGTHDDGKERVVLTVKQDEGIERLKQLQIGDAAIPLSKLADIGEVAKDAKDIVTFDGQSAISYTVFLQPGQDIPSMDKTIAKKLDRYMEDLPKEVTAHTYESQAENVNSIFDSLYISLLIAVIAVLVVTTAGLTLYGSFAVALTVLASVLVGLIPIPFMGGDLNQISVIGLIIAIGILVDDSIVVNDNIQRRYKLGDSPLDGAVNGVKEVYTSIISSSLAIVVTFSPLLLLSGGNGAFIKALPSILITTIIASTVLSVTLVPMLQYIKTKKRNKKISDTPGFLGKPLEKIAVFYSEKVLRTVLKRPLLVGIGGLVIATGLLFLAMLTPFEFFPAADKEEVTMNVRLAAGTTIDETNNEIQKIIDEVSSEDENVKETAIFTGSGLPNLFAASMENTGENTGQAVFRIKKDNTSASEFIDKWEPELRDRFSDAEIFLDTIVQGPPVGAPVTVTIKGEDIDQLAQLRDDLKNRLLEKGADIVTDNLGEPVPAIQYEPNRQALEDNGISLSLVTNQLQLLTQGVPLFKLYEGDISKQVVLKEKGVNEGEEIDLSQSVVPSMTTQGPPKLIPLNELLSSEKTSLIAQVPHEKGERAITLKAYGDADGFKAGMLDAADTEKKDLPEGYTISTGGENSDQQAFFAEIGILFLVVLLLVYLVIAFQFKSFSLPLLVLFAVYLGISGAILGLFITQTPLSFLGVMGIVSLTGIVVRNAVVLIDFVEARRLLGNMDVIEAIVESGYARIKPIILTSLTSIVALIPVAVSGDPLFEALAITIIAGLAFSSLFTLVMIPSLYLVYYKLIGRKAERV